MNDVFGKFSISADTNPVFQISASLAAFTKWFGICHLML